MTREVKGIAASGHPLVSGAARTVLERGGNAFDAAVAAGFMAAVAEPALSSLGGGGFMLTRSSCGQETLFDFFVDTPGKGLSQSSLTPHFFPVTVNFPGVDQDFNVGLGSVAVPGNLKGLAYVHGKLGSMPLKEIVEPAATAAREGVRLTGKQAYFLRLLRSIMTMTEEGRRIFSPGGKYVDEGDLLVNKDLARFLKGLASGGMTSFYEGEIAFRIDQDMRRENGLLTMEDLESYRVVERRPEECRYRGLRFLSNPPPSFGGSLIKMTLQALDKLDFSPLEWSDPNHFLSLASVMDDIDRLRGEGIHFAGDFPGGWVESAASRAMRLFSRGTTHVSVLDARGNAASLTMSNGEGSGYVVPGTGIMLNNMMGEDDLHPDGFHSSPPGLRVSSMMSPSMIFDQERLLLVLGSGGSKRIRSAVTQVLINVVDFHMDLKDAVEAPRIHLEDGILQVERGIPEPVVKALSKHWEMNLWGQRDVYFGGVHCVTPEMTGAGDPRRGGAVSVALDT